jgi:hypothetical protein
MPKTMDDKFAINRNQLKQDGVTVLRGVFAYKNIKEARTQIIKNRYLFKNTRPTPSSGHIAGFHRFPMLESLHSMLSCNPIVNDFIDFCLNNHPVRSIGLSDITINRSQHWHTDLLRGKYFHFIKEFLDWNDDAIGIYKVLLYLQDGKSLQYIRGSHLNPISLDNDHYAEPNQNDSVVPVSVFAGDIVIMDIRCSHRGAEESIYATGNWDDNPRILISTVLAKLNCPLANALEVGNFHRLQDWMRRYP